MSPPATDGPEAGTVGLVVVSHSPALAEAAVALALEMVHGDAPPVAVAAGTPDGGTGTDATAVLEAVERVGGPAGVLVVMDLGSAVLSAELALELAGDLPYEVRLSTAPFVEGVVTAVVQAAAGAPLAEVAEEAAAAGGAKSEHLGPPGTDVDGPVAVDGTGDGTSDGTGDGRDDLERAGDAGADVVREVTVVNPHGLHARPAAVLAQLVRGFDADVRLSSTTTGRGPVPARSLVGVQSLGAVRDHVVQVHGTGPEASAAVEAVVEAVREGFGEGTGPAPERPPAGATTGRATSPPNRTAGSGPASTTPSPGADEAQERGLLGTPAAPGRGWGPAWHLDDALPALPESPAGDPAQEQQRLDGALEAAAGDLRESTRGADTTYRDVVAAQLLLLEDDALLGPAREAVATGSPAETAWQDAVDAAAADLAALQDEYLAARAADVRAVGRAVRRRLQGVARGTASRPGVLLARDLAPDDVRALDPDVVTAVVTAEGSPTSHATLLARAAGLPLVVAAGERVLDAAEGTRVAVDGDTGAVLLEPDEALLLAWRAERDTAAAHAAQARERARGPARTRDGVHVHVAANTVGAEDTGTAAAHGADGVGLLRTELLFGGRTEPPDEEEQLAAYLAVAAAVGGQRVVVRTLDVGGDKPVPYADQPVEANPFLGLRGIRLQLERPRLLAPQLRAVVRAAQQTPLGVMFPMVGTLAELHRARAALADAARDLGLPAVPAGLEVGVMVEVPALALRARHLRGLVDFVSVGTNDLTQYALAAERGNPDVAGVFDALDPAVLTLLAATCDGVGPDVRVAVCGELAADPAAVPLLVGLGVQELSVGPRSVPAVKDRVRTVDAAVARGLARRCVELPDADAVRELVAREAPPGRTAR